jgi:transglutaminase-like putative cysteine protease
VTVNDLQLTRTALLWQLLSVVVALLPHVFHLPNWITFVVLLCIAWRLMVYLGRWSLPSKWVKTGLVLAAGVGVLASYKQGGGISITVALLVVGFGLKVIELYHRRDALIVLYVAYLVVATSFLFSQSVGAAVYALFALIIVTTALMSTNISRETRFTYPLKRSVLMLIPAFPLMVVLFIAMPRFGPLWEVGLDKSAAKTGLSDTMTPGDITRLTRSAEVAFRVSFSGSVPDQTQLYWRAIVLNDFDGRGWLNDGKPLPKFTPTKRAEPERLFRYELILEASQQHYVPVLDYPVSWPRELNLHRDMTLSSGTKVVNREQYPFTSGVVNNLDVERELDDFERTLYLPAGNEKAKQLARRWWAETETPDGFIAKIQQYYHQGFHYSLTPPPLGDESVSDFLLNTKTGFCGHFASATAVLLRAVGIPARIVTGYQGGEWNPYENYFLVRQYDAHAWVEAWFLEKGWVRLDPTAWVAPSRVEAPADETLSTDRAFLQDSALSAWNISNNKWIMQVRHRIEALNYGWHRWVLNYHHQQQGLLERLLGGVSPLKLALFLLLPFSVVIAITVALSLNARKVAPLNPVDKLIVRLSTHFAKEGLERQTGETVSDYCDRLARHRPDDASHFMQISAGYERIRHGQGNDPELVVQLRQAVVRCTNARGGLFARLCWWG